jgi:ligand-binding sensor domain-containing protein
VKRLPAVLCAAVLLGGCAASNLHTPPGTESFPPELSALSLSPVELLAFKEIDEHVFPSGGRTWVVMPRSLLALNGSFIDYSVGEADGLLGPILSADHDDSNVWLGTTRGVNQIDTESLFVSAYMAPSDSVDSFARYLVADARDGVFIVTRQAVCWIDVNGRTWRSYAFDRFDFGDIRHVVFSNRFIWIGTRVGLRRFSREWKAWDVVPGNRELAKTEILTLEEDEGGTLWALSTRGLHLYDPKFDTWQFVGR